MHDLAQLDSSARTALQGRKKTQPEKREDIIPLMKSIENNDHLLAFYLKYNRMFGKSEIANLIIRLEENLLNMDDIKRRQQERFKRRKERLKKLNKNIELA